MIDAEKLSQIIAVQLRTNVRITLLMTMVTTSYWGDNLWHPVPERSESLNYVLMVKAMLVYVLLLVSSTSRWSDDSDVFLLKSHRMRDSRSTCQWLDVPWPAHGLDHLPGILYVWTFSPSWSLQDVVVSTCMLICMNGSENQESETLLDWAI